jgi:hypothetical protein
MAQSLAPRHIGVTWPADHRGLSGRRKYREPQQHEQTTEDTEGTENCNCLEQTTEGTEDTENCNCRNKKLLFLFVLFL